MVDQAGQHVIFRSLRAEELNALMNLQSVSLPTDRMARRKLCHLLRLPTAWIAGWEECWFFGRKPTLSEQGMSSWVT